MEQLKGLSLGRKLLLGGGLLLLIDTFLNWQQVSVSVSGVSVVSAGQSAWHGFWGILLGLLTVLLLIWVAARAFGVALPANIPDGVATLGVAAVIVLFALIKIVSDSYVHWPAYLGIVLAVVVAGGAWLNFQSSGEALPRMPMATATAGTTSSTSVETPASTADDEPPTTA